MNSNTAIVVPAPAPMQATQDIRGIIPPLEISGGSAWIWWVIGLIAVLLAAWFVYRWLNKKDEKPPVVPVTPPHVIAKQRLQQALTLLSDPKAFCTAVSDTIRVYLEDRFHFHAPERTTEEFLMELQSTDLLLPDQKESLSEFLQVCDLVKFARHEPNETALRELHDAACRLVDETQFDSAESGSQVSQAPVLPPALPVSTPPPAGEETQSEASDESERSEPVSRP